MAACLPFLLLPNPLLLLLLLATLGVGGPSFHSVFGRDDVRDTAAGVYFERDLGRPLNPVDTFPLGPSGPPIEGIFGDSIGTSPLLARRTRSSPPHIDPYYRYIFDPIKWIFGVEKMTENLTSIWCQFPKSAHRYPHVIISSFHAFQHLAKCDFP